MLALPTGSLGIQGRLMALCRSLCFIRTTSEFTRCRVPNNRLQKVDDVQPPAYVTSTGKRGTDSDKSADSRQNREHSKWHPHRRWRLVGTVWDMFVLSVQCAMRNGANMLAWLVPGSITG